MALLSRKRGPNFWDVAFVCIIVALLFIAVLMGCRVPVPTVITVHDSTTVHVDRRDTVITIPGDAARLDLSADLAALKRVIDELRKRPITTKGERNAQLTLSLHNDSVRIVATCDTLEWKLNDAITTIERRNERIQVLESRVQDQDRERPMPSWAKGIALAGTTIALLAIVVLLLLKRVFKLI